MQPTGEYVLMANYVRIKGNTFTENKTGKSGTSRGFRVHPSKISELYKVENVVSELAKYFRGEPELLIRKTISILDKVIKKPKRLKYMSLETYKDRTLLSVELWKHLESYFLNIAKTEGHKSELQKLAGMWHSKVHPYAENDFDKIKPENDENAKIIIANIEDNDPRESAQGRWHKALDIYDHISPDFNIAPIFKNSVSSVLETKVMGF